MMLHHALRIKAAETEHSMSELVEEAIKISLAEDSVDLAAFDERKKEPSLAFPAKNYQTLAHFRHSKL